LPGAERRAGKKKAAAHLFGPPILHPISGFPSGLGFKNHDLRINKVPRPFTSCEDSHLRHKAVGIVQGSEPNRYKSFHLIVAAKELASARRTEGPGDIVSIFRFQEVLGGRAGDLQCRRRERRPGGMSGSGAALTIFAVTMRDDYGRPRHLVAHIATNTTALMSMRCFLGHRRS
jgi:hypothetical protein